MSQILFLQMDQNPPIKIKWVFTVIIHLRSCHQPCSVNTKIHTDSSGMSHSTDSSRMSHSTDSSGMSHLTDSTGVIHSTEHISV